MTERASEPPTSAVPLGPGSLPGVAAPQGHVPDGDQLSSLRKHPALAMSLGALGIVYGDIGTSPLYAIKECFHGAHAVPVTHANVLGVLSLVFWSLTMVVSIKYVAFILRADNKGEGGIFA